MLEELRAVERMWKRQFLQSNNPDSLVQPSSCHNSSECGVVLSCVIFTVLHGTGQVHSPDHAALGIQYMTDLIWRLGLGLGVGL